MTARICIGIDNGHHAHKVYDHVGKMSQVLTRAKLGEDQLISMMADSKSDNLTVVTDGIAFTCGRLRKYEEVNPKTFPESQLSRVLLNYALAMHDNGRFLESAELQICTGLPLGRYYKAGKPEVDAELIQSVTENLSRPVTIKLPNGKEITKSLNVSVKAQTRVAWYAYILEEQRLSGGDPSKPKVIKHDSRMREPVAMIDIGGGTTEVCVIEDGAMDMTASGSEFIGSNDVRKNFEAMICDKFRMDAISAYLIDKALIDKVLPLDGALHDVKSLYDEAHSAANAKLLNFIKNKLGTNRQRELNAVRLIGGGCNDFRSAIEQSIARSEMVQNPQFENAKGMYLLARYLSK